MLSVLLLSYRNVVALADDLTSADDPSLRRPDQAWKARFRLLNFCSRSYLRHINIAILSSRQNPTEPTYQHKGTLALTLRKNN